MTRIEGKVAAVLNDRELVMNRGSDDGVEVDMVFDVLHPSGSEVRDPEDPSVVLGTVEWPKYQVRVVAVQNNMSVARTFRRIHVPASGKRSIMDNYLAATSFASTYKPASSTVETFRSDEPYAQREVSEQESVVKIGDPIVQHIDVEHDEEDTED